MIIRYCFSKALQPVSLKKQTVTLFILLSCALVLLGAVLLTSQKYADGDEAVIGIMAKHILEKGERPLFFYGQPYNGGGAIEAYLAVIPFAVFGTSSIALKSVALCFWLVSIALCYLFCLRFYDYATAIFSSIILITATALIEWHLKMRGGYALIPMFFMIILLYFSCLVGEGPHRWWRFLLFGLFCGLAYYNMEMILPFLFTLLLFTLFWRRNFWNCKSVPLTVVGFIIGASPLLLFNITHGFINFKYVLGRGVSDGGTNVFSHFYTLVFIFLPRFFVGRNVDQYIGNPPVRAYLEYAVYLLLFAFLSIKIWPQVRKLAVSFFSPGGVKGNHSAADIEVLLVAYLVIYSIISSISGNMMESPRYFLPLYPALAIVAARGINRLCMDQRQLSNVTGIIFLSALIFLGTINHLAYIGQSWVNDDVLIQGQGRVNRKTSGDTISAIIEYLKKRQISRVWCTYFVQWRLLFESNEKVIASSYKLIPGAVRYPLYDAIVWEHGKPQVIILHQEDIQLSLLHEQSVYNRCERELIGEYEILITK